MYKVLKRFADLADNGYVYNEGDKYPRDGVDTTDERIAELAGTKNRVGTPLITEVKQRRKRTKE